MPAPGELPRALGAGESSSDDRDARSGRVHPSSLTSNEKALSGARPLSNPSDLNPKRRIGSLKSDSASLHNCLINKGLIYD
jgi:hypothetical protein